MKFTMIRRITALGLILVLAAGIPIQASSASTEKVTEDDASTKSLQEAQDEKAQLEKALKEAQGTIEDLKDSKGDIESKVTELNQQLIDISARITDLENQLTAKSEDIPGDEGRACRSQREGSTAVRGYESADPVHV